MIFPYSIDIVIPLEREDDIQNRRSDIVSVVRRALKRIRKVAWVLNFEMTPKCGEAAADDESESK